MRSEGTKIAVVTSTIGIGIDKNNLARRHRAAAEGARSQLGLEVANVPRQALTRRAHR